jgi:NSS family neurotransmitter:Na+ symporter
MLTYGSYMRRSEDIPGVSGLIAVMITVVALMAGLMIFPIIFTFDFPPEAGPGLVFKTLPILFAKLPGALLISTAFFTLFVFTALTSAIALVEVVAANLIDLLGWTRKKAVLLTGAASFIFGIPSALSNTNLLFGNWQMIYGKNFFETVDAIVSVWMLPIGGLMIAIYVGWVLSPVMLKEEFEAGSKYGWLFKPWVFFIRWIAPIAIICIFLQQSGLINFDTLFQRS